MRIDEKYQQRVLARWEKVLDAGGGIQDAEVRAATAMVLENVQNETDGRAVLMNESFDANGVAAAPGGAFGSYTQGQYADADARIPTIVVPMLRRIFPQLVAHELCGVQPMNGPVGFVFALRAEYATNRGFETVAGGTTPAGTEIGYNNLDSVFAGTSATTSLTATTPFQYYTGAANSSLDGGVIDFTGTGATLAQSEGAQLKTDADMPMARFSLKKAVVEARTRKLGGLYSLELAEDMKNQHGLNVDTEMASIITYEIQAGIDRNIVSEMVRSAIVYNQSNSGQTVSTWSAISADGRNQIERIGTLYTHLLDKSQKIAQLSRRGAGNFVIASPKVVALLQRFGMKAAYGSEIKSGAGAVGGVDTTGIGNITKIGMLESGQMLYRDTFAGGNYMLIGYKGSGKYDSGVIYSPYVPVQLVRTIDPYDLNPKIAARCRDAVIGETGRPTGWEAGKYYQFVGIDGLTGALASDSSGDRVFTY